MNNLSYSINDIVRLTNIGRTKIYEAINRGELTAKKYGQKTLVLHEDLTNFLNNLSQYNNKNKRGTGNE